MAREDDSDGRLCCLNKQAQWKHERISSASCRSFSPRYLKAVGRRRSQNHHGVNWFWFSPSLRAVQVSGIVKDAAWLLTLRHRLVCFLGRPLSIATWTVDGRSCLPSPSVIGPGAAGVSALTPAMLILPIVALGHAQPSILPEVA